MTLVAASFSGFILVLLAVYLVVATLYRLRWLPASWLEALDDEWRIR